MTDSDLTKKAERLSQKINEVSRGHYGETEDDYEEGIRALTFQLSDVLRRQPFEDDPDPPYASLYWGAYQMGHHLNDLMDLANSMMNDFVRAVEEAEEARAASPEGVTWDQVNSLMRGGMSYVRERDDQIASWEAIKILRTKLDARGVARWLSAYHWEPWDTRLPAKHDSQYVRHTLLGGRRGYVTDPKSFEDDKRHGGPSNINGVPSPDKVLVTYSGRRRRLKAKDLYPGCCLWWKDNEPCWTVYQVIPDSSVYTICLKRGEKKTTIQPYPEKDMLCRDEDFAAWVPTRFLERGRQRFRLIEDGRSDELLNMAREAVR